MLPPGAKTCRHHHQALQALGISIFSMAARGGSRQGVSGGEGAGGSGGGGGGSGGRGVLVGSGGGRRREARRKKGEGKGERAG